MLNYKYALLLDDLFKTEQSKSYIDEISSKSYDVTIFTIIKEQIIPNPLAIFSIADFWNWKGVSIITSNQTLEKSEAYPVAGLKIIVGPLKTPGYFNVEKFDLDLIHKVLEENKDK